MAKQLKIDNFFPQRQQCDETVQNQSANRLKDEWPYPPNMTLDQFTECTNIRELLTADMRKKIPHMFQKKFREIDMFVRKTYQRYMSDPSYRRKSFFKDLKFSPKPWLTKRDHELRRQFKIESCLVDMCKDNIVKDIADICVERGLSYHGEGASEAIKASVPSYINDVFERCIHRRKTFNKALKSLKKRYSKECNWSKCRKDGTTAADSLSSVPSILPSNSTKPCPLSKKSSMTYEYFETTEGRAIQDNQFPTQSLHSSYSSNNPRSHSKESLNKICEYSKTTDGKSRPDYRSLSIIPLYSTKPCPLSKKILKKTSECSKTHGKSTENYQCFPSSITPSYLTKPESDERSTLDLQSSSPHITSSRIDFIGNCIPINNFIKDVDIYKVLSERLERISPGLSGKEKVFFINKYSSELIENIKHSRADLLDLCTAIAEVPKERKDVVNDAGSRKEQTTLKSPEIVSKIGEISTKSSTSRSLSPALSLVVQPVSKRKPVKRKLEDVPNENAKRIQEISTETILSESINFDDFKKYTNIKEYICADIMKKYPITYKKYLSNMDKLIKRFYNNFIKNAKKWPPGLYIKSNFRPRTEVQSINLSTENSNSKEVPEESFQSGLVVKRQVYKEISNIDRNQIEVTQKSDAMGDKSAQPKKLPEEKQQEKKDCTKESKLFVSPDVFSSSSEETNYETSVNVNNLNANMVYVDDKVLSQDNLILSPEKVTKDPLQTNMDLVAIPCILSVSPQPFLFSSCSETTIKEEPTKSNEKQQNEGKLDQPHFVKEERLNCSDYENEVEIVPCLSPEPIIIPDEEMSVSFLLDELMKPSGDSVSRHVTSQKTSKKSDLHNKYSKNENFHESGVKLLESIFHEHRQESIQSDKILENHMQGGSRDLLKDISKDKEFDINNGNNKIQQVDVFRSGTTNTPNIRLQKRTLKEKTEDPKVTPGIPSKIKGNISSVAADHNQITDAYRGNFKSKDNKKMPLRKGKKPTDQPKSNADIVPQKSHFFGPLSIIRKIRDINQVTCPVQATKKFKQLETKEPADADFLIEDASQLIVSPTGNKNSIKFTTSQLLNTDNSFFSNFQLVQSPLETSNNIGSTLSNINVLPETALVRSSFTPEILIEAKNSNNDFCQKIKSKIISDGKETSGNLTLLHKKLLLPPQFGSITYLSLHQIVLNTKISQLKYESSVPFLQSFDKQSIQATINFRSNGFNQLNIYGQSIRFLLGLTQNEWSCFRNILQAIETFKYQSNDPEPVNKSLPYRVLYYLFKTLPKFAQVNFEFEDSNINDVTCFKISASYYRPVGCLSHVLDSYVLESMEKIKKQLYS